MVISTDRGWLAKSEPAFTIALTKIVGYVEAWWTRLSHRFKVDVALRCGSRVNHFPFCKHNESMEERDDVASRLVNGEDHRSIIGFR